MHPAWSVIVFTVLSGAGLGLLAALGVAPALGFAPPLRLWGLGAGLLLTCAGLASSTLHLGHPERAWRALTQWRSSWLSREGVLALATVVAAAIHAAALARGGPALATGLAMAALAAATVYATAMIYASLRTVARWRQSLTARLYLTFSAAGGALGLALLCALADRSATQGMALLAAAAVGLALCVQQAWWTAGDRAAEVSTPETATGLGHLGRVRMLESPHTGGSYLISEMGFVVARRRAAALRRLAWRAGLAAILLAALAAAGAAPATALALAGLAYLISALVSRWLFFAEARHAVMAYYDRGDDRQAA
jgi:DMSO reductase anchor subunit